MQGVPKNFRTILGEEDKFYNITKALIMRFPYKVEEIMEMPTMTVQELYNIVCEESEQIRQAGYGRK